MKKKTQIYKEEPIEKGWKFDEKAKPLTASQIRSLGIPEVGTAKTIKVVVHSHGGARSGAGRKSSGRLPILLRMLPQARIRIESYAKKHHLTLSEAVETLVMR